MQKFLAISGVIFLIHLPLNSSSFFGGTAGLVLEGRVIAITLMALKFILIVVAGVILVHMLVRGSWLFKEIKESI